MSNSGDGGDDAARQFASITGADASTAAFFLDSCNGDLQSAVDRFFAEDGDHSTVQPADFVPPRPNVRPDPVVPSSGAKSGTKATPGVHQQAGNVRGLSDYLHKGNSENGMPEDDDADDDDSDGAHNEYYTGGEKSGTTVRGGREKDRERGRVDGLFDSARRHGAVAGTEEDLRPGGSERVRVFTGMARTLTGRNSHTAPDTTSETVARTITFYANGVFTVDGGEPRAIADPSNEDFVACLARGECPRELEAGEGQPVNVNLVRKEVDYTPPEKPKYVAFSGRGQTLSGGQSNVEGTAEAGGSGTSDIKPGAAWEGPDESRPVTSIQLRLHDGSRMVARFNHSQTVHDIRRFIASSRPDCPLSYSLVTAFPSKHLTEDSQTIEDAGLVNAVVMQKL